MAHVVHEVPRDTVVVHDKESNTGSNAAIVIAVIVGIIALFILFGGRLFGRGGGGNVETPRPSAAQQ